MSASAGRRADRQRYFEFDSADNERDPSYEPSLHSEDTTSPSLSVAEIFSTASPSLLPTMMPTQAPQEQTPEQPAEPVINPMNSSSPSSVPPKKQSPDTIDPSSKPPRESTVAQETPLPRPIPGHLTPKSLSMALAPPRSTNSTISPAPSSTLGSAGVSTPTKTPGSAKKRPHANGSVIDLTADEVDESQQPETPRKRSRNMGSGLGVVTNAPAKTVACLVAELNYYKQELGRSNAELTQVRNEKRLAETHVMNLKDERASLTNQVLETGIQRNDFCEERDFLRVRLADANQELESLAQDMRKLQAEKADLEAQAAKLQKAKVSAESKHGEALSTMEKLREEIKELRRDANRNEAAHQELKGAFDQASKGKSGFEKDKIKLLRKVEELQKGKDASQEEKDIVRKERNDAQDTVKNLQKEIEEMQKAKEALQTEKHAWQESTENLEKEKESLQKAKEELEKKRACAAKTMQDLLQGMLADDQTPW